MLIINKYGIYIYKCFVYSVALSVDYHNFIGSRPLWVPAVSPRYELRGIFYYYCSFQRRIAKNGVQIFILGIFYF